MSSQHKWFVRGKELYYLIRARPGVGVLEKIQLGQCEFERIWVISSTWLENGPGTYNTYLVNRYMKQNYTKVLEKEKDGVDIELYTKKTTREKNYLRRFDTHWLI